MKDGAHRHDKDKDGLHGHEQYEGKGFRGAVIKSTATIKRVGNKTITTRITKIINKVRKLKKRVRKQRKFKRR